ncbi:MjaI family restriction endonuclease [Candidatus Woesearchaeota archaeon]|nr:MjaI family restriction endonuclease [Candidatus Woesearchaeota archaeon]
MSKNEDLSEYTEIKLDVEEEFKDVIGDVKEFPKYTTQIINLANQNSQGTRPKVVGQLSELIHKCPVKTFKGWKEWYEENYPDAVDKATKKVSGMIEKLREAISKIDDEMIKEWVEDLVITKTAEGLVIQEAILKNIAERLGEEWVKATPEDESKNIDGYIGETPVQIKPSTYLSKKPTVRDNIEVEIIYYKKTSKYLYIYTKML